MLSVDVQHRLGDFLLNCKFESDARVTGLFGPSGAGKSSLLRIMAGLIVPDSGRVELAGRCVFDSRRGIQVPAHKRRIGYVFQQARLFPHFNVRHNLGYGAWFAGAKARPARFDQIVDMLDLGALLERRIAGLSGGEQQRVAIGRALLANPALLLLDEPLASLDAARRNEVLPYLERLSADADLPIVFVTHQLDELLRLANRQVVAIRDGSIAFCGPTADFLARPALLGVDQAHDAGALLRVTLCAQHKEYGLSALDCDGQCLFVPHMEQSVGSAVTLHVRARDVMLARERPAQISALNILRTTIERIDADDDHAVGLLLHIGGQSLKARITRQSADRLALCEGESVYAIIKSLALAEQAWERLRDI